MRFQLDGTEYRVRFSHYREGVDGEHRSRTVCTIYHVFRNLAGDQPLEVRDAIGMTVLRPGDTYCKETGRKLAFARALDQLIGRRAEASPATREQRLQERQLCWDAYFHRGGRLAWELGEEDLLLAAMEEAFQKFLLDGTLQQAAAPMRDDVPVIA